MQKGFSLVELSIVLVILGLLTGGILTGQSLIESAKLRKITSDISEFQSAIYQYKDKYRAIPGDHKMAYDFFDGSGGSSVCGSNNVPGGGGASHSQCNGDGNGQLHHSYHGEPIRAWHHLQLAGFLNGRVNGGATSGAQYVNPWPLAVSDGGHDNGGFLPNIPASPFGGTGGYSFTGEIRNGTHGYYGKKQTAIMLGRDHPSSAHHKGGGATPVQAWQLDTKMDDGVPSSGKIYGINSSCVQTVSGPGSGADWNLRPGTVTKYFLDAPDENLRCTLHFLVDGVD